MFGRRRRDVLPLRFAAFHHRIMDGIRFVAGLFRIVGAIGALHRLCGLAQLVHRGFQLRRQVIQAGLFHLLEALLELLQF